VIVNERDMPPDLLRDALRSLAAEDSGLAASPVVEAQLRAHVRSLRRVPRRRTFPYIAAAASIAIAALVWHVMPSPETPGQPTARQTPRRALVGDPDGEFLPLPYAHVPASDGQVVRIAVPRAAMASFGLDPDASGMADVVEADVFIGEDGIARSVRFVGWIDREEPTP
jgi:hypothetical protein